MLRSLVLVLAAASVWAKPLLEKRWDDLEVKHAWVETPRGWTYTQAAPAEHKMEMRIGLKQNRLDDLINSLYQVSDPAHERYGQHLSKEQVEELVKPHPDSVDLVEQWLEHHGIQVADTHRSGGGDWVKLIVTVDQAERMLGTKYNVYQHESTSETVVRTLSYSLPSVLHAHIQVITPTTYFGTIKSMKATSFRETGLPTVDKDDFQNELASLGSLATVPSSCSSTITPSCLRALYNTSSYTPQATSTNQLGVAGYLGEYATHSDLQTFLQKFRSDAAGADFTVVQVNGGGNDQSNPGTEANLDIQYTESISYPTPNIYYSTGGSPPYISDSETTSNTNEPYLDWLNYILNQTSVPQTFTTSYGDDEQTVPIDYATSVCNLYAQLGARGSSILFSSGDFGVGGGQCTSNDGTDTVKFQPIFPASCPYVTSVGGTYKVNPEVAVDFSSGGFSNYFARPSYQSSAVSTFLTSLGSSYSDMYNSSGRGFPDVSAQGRNFQVVIDGSTSGVSGTSASSPTFAGVVTLLNDYRIASGKAPLGFLNPWLYGTGVDGLNDITSGSNPGCDTDGFTARAGWDPVTGLGTPDFGKLQALL
ncbi:subtilisin-like protein [Neolentinus lepideus HHB14362 ss-1]|uniref:tripeptidyl-peptidase II n=1 Tax=Neolentinus lepideus HHB14362 ss-1 TaxID=1314782 RepID=A0A165PL90_9AGAM|nr:subtilisin-like protein [Neolentinus lepideus HHB14362 ss-1]